jgi:hypothetical protein
MVAVSGTKGRGFDPRIARHFFFSLQDILMKKWIGLFFSLLLILAVISILGFYGDSQRATEKKEEAQVVLTQDREGGEKKGEKDTVLIDLLRQLKQTVDGWLKSINEKIEDEDVTRFKVRFLEILRSFLEWVKEKIDSWLEASEKDMREKGGPFREIHQRRRASSGLG